MNEIVTESTYAQCELRRILNTVRMIEQSADTEGDDRLLLEVLSSRKFLTRLGLVSHHTKLLTTEKNTRQHQSGVPLRSRFGSVVMLARKR